MIMIKLRMFSYNFAYTIMSVVLYYNLKGKLQKHFYFCKMSDAPYLTCWLKYHMVLSCRGIGQFNCDNRSQERAEAIYGSFDFIGPTGTS